MFYESIIFQKVYPYSSILITIFTYNQLEISSIYDTFYQTKTAAFLKKDLNCSPLPNAMRLY